MELRRTLPSMISAANHSAPTEPARTPPRSVKPRRPPDFRDERSGNMRSGLSIDGVDAQQIGFINSLNHY